MLQLVSLQQGSISIGIPLPWHIYDANGNRILNRGEVIETQEKLNRLFTEGIFARRDKILEKTELASQTNILSALGDIEESLDELLRHIVGTTSRNIEEEIFSLAQRIITHADQHPDQILRWVHIDKCSHYVISHAIHMAIVVALISKRIGMPDTNRQSLTAAALTANVSMMEVQEELNAQTEPLSERQHQLIEQHPERSADLLRQAEVSDDHWLEIVLLHHEKLDGTGYPLGLSGHQLPMSARLVALADAYTAMLTKRGYREERMPQAALKELFLLRGEKLDNSLVEIFIKEIGLFPPGSIVKLKNGEVAVVARRGQNVRHPVVQVLLDNKGAPYPYSVERDTSSQPQFEVSKILQTDALAKLLS